MKLLYFAWLRERIGVGSEDVTPPEGVETVAALVDWLKTREPRYEHAFAQTASIRVAIDQEQSDFDGSIIGAREVALFPPVTGG
jgi:molybdopterin synthase sulfur carrier subunit